MKLESIDVLELKELGKLPENVDAMKAGAAEMKDGTAQFRSEATDIDEQIEEQIDKMVEEFSGKNYVPVLFASDKNMSVEAVRFTFQTEPIRIVEEITEEEEEESKSIWDKFRVLFD